MDYLLQLALAPTVLLSFFIYVRDKFEKEPLYLIIRCLLGGIAIIVPVWYMEKYLTLLMPPLGRMGEAFYISFVVASFTEELFKFLAVYFIAFRHHHFNEPFDGIVYSVFVSLGFATVENIMYVLGPATGGLHTAIGRAIFSVPGHALFGVTMGYELGLAKFCTKIPKVYFRRALIMPILFHGLYDFILLANSQILMIFFVPFIIFLWIRGFKNMKAHHRISPFNPEMEHAEEEDFERLHPHG